MLHPACTTQEVEGCGRGVVAVRAISRGEIIIQEEPLVGNLQELESEVPQIGEVARRHLVEPTLVEVPLAFACASPSVQQAILGLHCPDPTGKEGSQRLLAAKAGAVAAQELGQVAASGHGRQQLRQLSLAELEKVELIWSFNSHVFRGKNSLFLLASRLNHSCSCNTSYLSYNTTANSAQWVASRDIAAGEEVTTSYSMEDDALPAPMRQKLLWDRYWCTNGIDLCGQLPCPLCYPAVREADTGYIKSARKVGQLDKDTGKFTFHDILSKCYIGCDMSRRAAGHPRPWVCGHCGGEFADTAEELFPPALLRRRRWKQRPDLELANTLWQLDRRLDLGIPLFSSSGEAVATLDALYTEALSVLGFQHYAVYKVLQMQVEIDNQILAEYASSVGLLPWLSRQTQQELGRLIAECQRKWAMAWELHPLLKLPSGGRAANFGIKMLTSVEALMQIVNAGERKVGAENVTLGRLVAAQLIRRVVREYGLRHPEFDVGGRESRQLLRHWASLLRATGQAKKAPDVARLQDADWQQLRQALAFKGGSLSIQLFDSSEEASAVRSWLAGSAG